MHSSPSMKWEADNKSSIRPTYFTTSSSVLKQYPHTLCSELIAMPAKIPSVATHHNAVLTAIHAAFGLPPPSSFETLILIIIIIIIKKIITNCM